MLRAHSLHRMSLLLLIPITTRRSSSSLNRWISSTSTNPHHRRRYHHNTHTTNKIHDVIIVGGGPTGLLLSNLLSSYNVHSHLLFEKQNVSNLLKHPQAHYLNIRSMEILKAELPNVHEGVLNEMPNVDEWEGFHFGGSVLELENSSDCCYGGGGKRLGRVIHPVRKPLKVGQTGNGILVPHHSNGSTEKTTSIDNEESDDSNVISACRPAHLAQNKFVSLLLQEAARRRHGCYQNDNEQVADYDATGDNISNIGNSGSHLRYGEEVIGISEHTMSSSQSPDTNNNEPPIITIQTSKGQSYHTRYLLAADGVHSFARKHYGIPMRGDSCIQNLINVHFRTNEELSKLLMKKHTNQAMLHFVYNSQVVGAFVCHDGNKGEWVLQVPYFPPFQTIHDDFDTMKVRDMIWAGLVGVRDEQHTQGDTAEDDLNFDILSIRPWTMSSLVAQTYLNDSKNMMLIGDAAHAFPPAGGFGMNTGLQDAHNIAWRIALALRCRHIEGNDTAGLALTATNILSRYEQERQPIATQNAALSVRNYQRTLRIAKACYLDAQHPQLLTSMLSSPPMSMLPLSTRQEMFRRLVHIAMMPLGSLCPAKRSSSSPGHSFHVHHIEKNVRSILDSGGSLPLVFPRYELGFSYDSSALLMNGSTSGDTEGYVPRLKEGHRMPHVLVKVLSSSHSGGNDAKGTRQFSLTDISSYTRQSYSSPQFTLLAVGPTLPSNLNNEAIDSVMERWNVPITLVHVLPDHESESSQLNDALSVVDTHQRLFQLLSDERLDIKEQSHEGSLNKEATESNTALMNVIVMVRPDGHICLVHHFHGDDKSFETSAETIHLIEQGLRNALG